MLTKLPASMLLVGLMACWISLGVTTPAMAFVIWSEPIDGDFPDFPNPWDGGNIDPDFVMPEGESTIDGDIVLPETPDDTDDWFTFEIPEGFEIPEARFEFTAPEGAVLGWEMYSFDPLFISVPELEYRWEFVLTPAEPFTFGKLQDLTPEGGGPPIGTIPGGKYGMRMKTAEDPIYSLTFVVRAVPEPTSLAMALLAVVGLLTVSRRARG